MTPSPQSSNTDLGNGSSDPIPAEDLLADEMAGSGLRAPVDTGVGAYDAIPPAAVEAGARSESSHSE